MDQQGDAQEILLGSVEVRCSGGEIFSIRPWGIRTGRKMIARIKTMLLVAANAVKGGLDLGSLMASSYDEIVGIVADTVGLTTKDLEDEGRFLLEDLFSLAEAILRVNFVERPGLSKNLLRLLATSEKAFVPQGAEQIEADPSMTPSPKPSSS